MPAAPIGQLFQFRDGLLAGSKFLAVNIRHEAGDLSLIHGGSGSQIRFSGTESSYSARPRVCGSPGRTEPHLLQPVHPKRFQLGGSQRSGRLAWIEAAGEIPNQRRGIETARNKSFAIGGECHLQHLALMAGETASLAAADCFHQVNREILGAAPRQNAAIRREREANGIGGQVVAAPSTSAPWPDL